MTILAIKSPLRAIKAPQRVEVVRIRTIYRGAIDKRIAGQAMFAISGM